MSEHTLWKCDGNAEPDPTKLPIWCEKLTYLPNSKWTELKHPTKENRHLCPDCKKNLVRLEKGKKR